jgi:hypothetical protein
MELRMLYRSRCGNGLSAEHTDISEMRGRIWVDSEDYALVRAEGNPAKNPSFWTKSTHFVQVYQKSGRLWFPLSTQSVTEARIFGTTGVSIEYFDYAPKASHPPDNSIMSAKETPKP